MPQGSAATVVTPDVHLGSTNGSTETQQRI